MAECGEVLLILSSEAVASFSFAISRVFRIRKVTAHGLLWWCSMSVQRLTSYPLPSTSWANTVSGYTATPLQAAYCNSVFTFWSTAHSCVGASAVPSSDQLCGCWTVPLLAMVEAQSSQNQASEVGQKTSQNCYQYPLPTIISNIPCSSEVHEGNFIFQNETKKPSLPTPQPKPNKRIKPKLFHTSH